MWCLYTERTPTLPAMFGMRINILFLFGYYCVNRLCFVFVMLIAGLYWNVKRLHDGSSISLHNFFKFGYICVV